MTLELYGLGRGQTWWSGRGSADAIVIWKSSISALIYEALLLTVTNCMER